MYQSPNDGDTYIPERTTLIIRPDATLSNGHSAGDFIFSVEGSASGMHAGEVIISDDNETIIFKPYQPFTVGEHVNVRFSVAGMENISPISYGFRISPLSEQERIQRVQSFRQSEELATKKLIAQNVAADTLPISSYVVDTLVPGKVAPGYIYTTRNGAKGGFLETLDNKASLLYQYEVFNPPCEDFRPWGNKVFSYIYSGQVFLLDSNHSPVDTFSCNGYQTDDHEFQLLPNGHVLLMANDTRDTDMRVVTGDPNASPMGSVIGAVIQELDQKKNVVFQWRTWDHFNIQDVEHLDITDPNRRSVDYCHLNSIQQDTDGNIIASFRAMDEVTKINRTNGKIIWRWGGKNNYFTFVGDTLAFSYQHDVRRIANGHITMMDNGNYHTTYWDDGSTHDTAWSRAIEYDLDESTLTARSVWEFANIDPTFAAGNVQRLPNGNTFICGGPLGLQKAIEVTAEGEKVFELSFPIGDFTYRMYRFPVPPAGNTAVLPQEASQPFEVRSIFPNPAENAASVTFLLPNEGEVHIDLLDVLGHTVRTTTERVSGTGVNQADLDLHGLSAGTYYCRFSSNGNTITRLLVVQK